MRWHRVNDLFEYWGEWPPVHEILKMVHRKQETSKAAAVPNIVDPNDPSGIGSLLTQFPNGFVTGDPVR